MRKKLSTFSLMLVVTTVIFAGCESKKVDYGLDGDAQKDKEDGEGSLAQFENAENWVDEWKFTGEDGEELVWTLDAKIVVPELDNMSVVEAKKEEMNASFREDFLKEFFQNGDIYYYDEAHYTRSEITSEIQRIEELQQENPEDDYLSEVLEEYQELLSQASDEYTKAEAFDSITEYAGYRDDYFYKVRFWDNDMSAWMVDETAEYPESLSEYPYISTFDAYSSELGEETPNECRYTMEEAKTLAESFLRELGRDNQICAKAEPIMWRGSNAGGESIASDDKFVFYGYELTYGTGVDGVAFTQFPDFGAFDITWRTQQDLEDGYNGDYVSITLTDKGITSLSIASPVTLADTIGPQTLLPLDTVKGIMKKEVEEHPEEYVYSNMYQFNEMQLMYMKMHNETGDGCSYVPVWCLSYMDEYGGSKTYMNPVLVNAIDGNVLYIMKASEVIE